MSDSPKNRFRGKKETEQAELENNKKIKPELGKFVIEMQRDAAEKAAKEKKKEDDILLSSDEVIQRASKLSCILFFEQKLWEKIPPYFEMQWLIEGPKTQQMIDEMNLDVGAFATYLVREYNIYLKYRTVQHSYPNPMVEENLMFFWNKFNADLNLLMAGERLRVQKGNQSILLDDVAPSKQGLILPEHLKKH